MSSSPRLPGRLAFLTACLAATALAACADQVGDAPANPGAPSPIGSGHRISDLLNPKSPSHPANGASVTITGATFLWVDTFDETANGKSKGTVYMQDVASTAPYSGVSLYSPTYVPANLAPAPGDVLDLVGLFSVNTQIGTAIFTAPDALTQISKPVVKTRFEYALPTPLTLDPSDLDDYAKGQQWVSMLVTIQNVVLPDSLVDDTKGRDTVHITSDVSTNGPTMANELFDVAAWNKSQPTPPLTKGTTIKSITGIVTWFYNYHLCPRSPADIVVQ